MRKFFKVTGLTTILALFAIALYSFLPYNGNKTVNGEGSKYSCRVEIYKPNGSQYVSGNIEAWIYREKNSTFFNDVKCWIDSDGKGTITWDSDLGDFVGRIYFREGLTNYIIKELELKDGGSYRLTAQEH